MSKPKGKVAEWRASGSLERMVGRFGFRKPSECIGHKCLHGVPGKWYNTVGTVESVTPGGRLAVRHWNRVHIVAWYRICDIYDKCPHGKYGRHRKTPNNQAKAQRPGRTNGMKP